MAAKKKRSAASFVLDAESLTGIGKRIRQVRGALNQDDFCKLIGLEKRTLVRYETGRTLPSADTLIRICHEFTINPTWLLMGYDDLTYGSIPPESRTLRRTA